MVADDFDFTHSMVFQSYSLGYIWSFDFPVFRGALVSREDKCAVLFLQALKISFSFKLQLSKAAISSSESGDYYWTKYVHRIHLDGHLCLHAKHSEVSECNLDGQLFQE